MFVSIIIPIYKVADYVEKCLLSALNQTYAQIEIILINDATPDNSMEVINNVLKNHPTDKEIRIINHKINKGLSAARNTGINASKGKYIFFLDGDDWLAMDCIEKQLIIAEKGNVDIVIGDGAFIGENPRISKWWDFNFLPDYLYDKRAIQKVYFSNKLYMMAWNKLIKKDFIINNQLFFKEDIIHEDDLWSYNLILVINSIGISKDTTYFYQLRENAIASQILERNIINKFVVAEEMLHQINEKNDFGKVYVLLYIIDVIHMSVFSNQCKNETIKYKQAIYKHLKTKLKYNIFKDSNFFLIMPLLIPYVALKLYFKVWRKLLDYKLIELPTYEK